MGVIKRARRLLGVRVWAVWGNKHVPHFTLFHYEGIDPTTGLYYFRLRGGTDLIIKTWEQLEWEMSQGSFKPFCIDPALSLGSLELR